MDGHSFSLCVQVGSDLAGKREQVEETHPVVAIKVHVVHIARIAPPAAKRAEEVSQVEEIYVAVAVAIAIQPEERVGTVAARRAIAVAVERSAETVVDLITANRQRIVAVRQRAANDARAGRDGKDLGADVDLVGPGAAYARWKNTPEYQEWLKETGQMK